MKKHINFLEKRSFGESLGLPFYFLKQEFAPFMGALLKYAAPFLVLSMIGFSYFSLSISRATFEVGVMPNQLFSLGLVGLFLALGYLFTFLITNSYITLYMKKGKGNFTQSDVLKLGLSRLFPFAMLLIIVQSLVMLGTWLFVLPGIYILVTLSFVPIVFFYEELGIFASIKISFERIKTRWFNVFGIFLVFGFIIGLFNLFAALPAYILWFMLIVGDAGTSNIIILILMFTLLEYFLVYLLGLALTQILSASLYFSIRAEQEGDNLFEKIKEINAEDNKIEEPENKDYSEYDNHDTNHDDYNRFAPKDEEHNRFKDFDGKY